MLTFLVGFIIGVIVGVAATILIFAACMLSSKISREEEKQFGKTNP